MVFQVVLVILINQVSFAQENLSVIDSYLDKLRRDKGLVSPSQLEYKDIQGSPYLIDEFRPGSLHMKSGNTLPGEFRYDVYADRIEFRKDDQVYHIAIPDSILKLYIREATIVYLPYSEKTDIKKGYFLALYEGYYSVYEKRTKQFQKAQAPQPYQDAPIPAMFQDAAPAIYMKVGDNPALRVSNTNDIVSKCGTEAGAAQDFIKRNKTRFRDISDITELFRYINGSISR